MDPLSAMIYKDSNMHEAKLSLEKITQELHSYQRQLELCERILNKAKRNYAISLSLYKQNKLHFDQLKDSLFD